MGSNPAAPTKGITRLILGFFKVSGGLFYSGRAQVPGTVQNRFFLRLKGLQKVGASRNSFLYAILGVEEDLTMGNFTYYR